MSFHTLVLDIKNCKTHKELLKVVKHIVNNSKKLGLDEYDLDKLESIGMETYERIRYENIEMTRNKKQGFNLFTDD